MARPIALWATPRTISTAFDRMMRERGDHHVLTEPFSVAYYDGPEQRSSRYPVTESDATFDAVLAQVMEVADRGPVFVKDMAYHLGPKLDADTLGRFANSFLIRDPARSLPSMAKIWPTFTTEEAGYQAQRTAFDLVGELTGETPVVIEATSLQTDPERVVGAWCERVGIEPRPEALTWEPGMPAGWERWADWFEGAATSTGFEPLGGDGSPADLDMVDAPGLAEAVVAARRHYDHLRQHAI